MLQNSLFDLKIIKLFLLNTMENKIYQNWSYIFRIFLQFSRIVLALAEKEKEKL
jgi:hypothetical protein